MKSTKTLGHCQCCGRQQAVQGGLMSKHGYTVEHGWFQGVCSGNRYKPMEHDRSETDSIVEDIRKEIPVLLEKAAAVEAGLVFPKSITRRSYDFTTRKSLSVEVAYEEATVREQQDACKSLAWDLKRRAAMGESFANQLEAIANKVHGQALQEVEKKVKQIINVGDVKISSTTGLTYTVTKVVGPRVYWKTIRPLDGKEINSWMGSQAWRKM